VPASARKNEIDIGYRLKMARTVRQLSQRELARKSGVTNGLISQIEQNQTNPTISSLKRILDAIPMSLAEFFSDSSLDEPRIFFRADEMRELNLAKLIGRPSQGGEVSLRQVGDSSAHQIQMLHECYSPGADTGQEMYTHDGEEAGIVVSGAIELTVGQETCVLGPGDGYLFDSQIPHRFRNLGSEDCVIVSACTPPTF
jgi:transcriptional regulator with XRE-family HTH domain